MVAGGAGAPLVVTLQGGGRCGVGGRGRDRGDRRGGLRRRAGARLVGQARVVIALLRAGRRGGGGDARRRVVGRGGRRRRGGRDGARRRCGARAVDGLLRRDRRLLRLGA